MASEWSANLLGFRGAAPVGFKPQSGSVVKAPIERSRTKHETENTVMFNYLFFEVRQQSYFTVFVVTLVGIRSTVPIYRAIGFKCWRPGETFNNDPHAPTSTL